jgi:hypothetical protein
MDGTSYMHWEMRSAYKILFRKPERMKLFGGWGLEETV